MSFGLSRPGLTTLSEDPAALLVVSEDAGQIGLIIHSTCLDGPLRDCT